jgi:glycosyltransferase involved in cell wall biosynthesis
MRSDSDRAGADRVLRGDHVTVVIPWWDRPNEWLLAAIESVREQQIPTRIIVVDNCSEMPLPPLDGVEVVSMATQGTVGAARNFGLTFVESETVVFLDADDLLLPGSLCFLTDLLFRRPDAVGVQGAQLLWFPETGDPERADPWPYPWMRVSQRALMNRRRAFAFLFATRIFYPIHGALLRTDAVRDAGGFGDARHAQDWELAISLALRGGLVLARHATYVYRRPSSITTLHAELHTMRLRPRMAVRARIRRRLFNDPQSDGWLRSRAARCALFAVHWVHNFLVWSGIAATCQRCGLERIVRSGLVRWISRLFGSGPQSRIDVSAQRSSCA